jgi:hypothetical protein
MFFARPSRSARTARRVPGLEQDTELALLPETVVGQEFDRAGRKILDRRARFPRKVGAEEHGAGQSRWFESESGRELEEIRQAGTQPGEIGKGLCEKRDIVSASSNADADHLAFAADCEEIDRGGFCQKTLGDHANRWIEALETVADRTA